MANEKDISKLLKKLNYDNWEDLAEEVAHAYFPIGNLVNYHHTSIHFGIVKSISKTGKITVQNGNMPLVKSKGHSPVYSENWYSSDVKQFEPFNEEQLSSWKKATSVFNPKGPDFERDSKIIKIYSPIDYGQIRGNRSLRLANPDIVKNWKKDLIWYESYCD
jgi:hypothetical protein